MDRSGILATGNLAKIEPIIKVLEPVDMTMVAQRVRVVSLAGVSLSVTTGHFDATFVLSAIGISFAERLTREGG